MTDEDRREVAEGLLELSGRMDTSGFDCLLAETVRGHDFCETPCDDCHRRLAAELADLIEPDCEEGSYEGVHTARPVDREALMALADELETDGVDHYIVSTQYVCDQYARRIREACGEVVG